MAPEVLQLHETIRTQQGVIERLEATIRKQQQQLEYYIRQMHGRKSEKLDVNQLLMDGVILDADGVGAKPEAPEAESKPAAKEAKSKKLNGRRPIPDHLPRNEILIDLPEEEKICPTTGEQRPLIGYEESEKLEYVPETLRVNVYKRAKYGSPTDGEENGVVIAPVQPELLPRCLADAGMLAHVAVSKFDDHLPLYRIEKMLMRQGVQVSRKTMSGWLAGLAKGLRPIAERIKSEILACGVVHHDDTPLKMLDPGAGKTKETRLWVAVSGHGPPLVHFSFSTSREQEHVLDFFRGYSGAVMCDEYGGYVNIDCGVLQSCWAHARRYVEKAKHVEPAFSTEVLQEIAKLYQIEKRAKDLTESQREQVRREHAAAQLEKVFELLESREFRPASPMTKARNYILKNRKALGRYVEDGRLPIDNNPGERAIRRVAIGRKNWLFLGSEAGGETAATLMTLLGSCWANRINAFAYLEAVIRELPKRAPDKFDDLLPHVWAEAHPEHVLPKQ